MSELNLFKLQTGLERDHGLDAVYLSGKSTTSFVYLVTPRGLPMDIGWFDNSQKSGNEPNHHALTTHPDKINNTHHRLILAQYEIEDRGMAHLTEQRSADYLEGYDKEPTIVSYDRLEQPRLAEKLRTFAIGACVLPASVGRELAEFDWINAYDVPAVEAYGQALITAGNYLVRIDDATLSSYAAAS